ncbi:MAG: hypothetical protein ACAH79_12895 [Thermoleophilia bacterium]
MRAALSAFAAAVAALSALGARGAYCVSDDGRRVVNVAHLDEVTSGLTDGRQPFPAGQPRDIDEGDAIVNAPASVACGSKDGRSAWCIAPEPGGGFALDGSRSGVRSLQDSTTFRGGPLGAQPSPPSPD